MFNESKLFAFVARELESISQEQRYADNRGIESAPYARHASPMARYQPMLRLLDDKDFAFLKMVPSRAAEFRAERRRVYGEYVDDLEREVERLLKAHTESGTATLDELHEEAKCSRSCIKQLRRHSVRHWWGQQDVPEMVAQTLRDLTDALHLGELVEMPLPAQAIA